ncbi:MAG: septum formation initiator family protein [Pseudomonadota bacterium]|nr:septum formation initiator family protein [Pseudomonadota bacterium]
MDLLARRLLLTLIPAGVVLALIHTTILGDSGLVRRHRMQIDLERAHRNLDRVHGENARIEREVRQLRSDETTVRRAAAEELLLVPPGSVVYRFGP